MSSSRIAVCEGQRFGPLNCRGDFGYTFGLITTDIRDSKDCRIKFDSPARCLGTDTALDNTDIARSGRSAATRKRFRCTNGCFLREFEVFPVVVGLVSGYAFHMFTIAAISFYLVAQITSLTFANGQAQAV